VAAVTLADVARDTGLSISTVSRVLNGSARRPAPTIVETVQKSADRLGYVRNAQAQALVTSQSSLIGVICNSLRDPYFASMTSHIQEEAARRGKSVLVMQATRGSGLELQAVRDLMAQRVAAIIVIGSLFVDDELHETAATLFRRFREGGGSVLAVGRHLGTGFSLQSDNVSAARDLVDRLVALGHRRFAVLADTGEAPVATLRRLASEERLEHHGLSAELVIEARMNHEGGPEAARQIHEYLGTRPDGSSPAPLVFLATSDSVAASTNVELHRLGHRVPQEVAIAGFGESLASAGMLPGLTTVSFPLEDMARSALHLVLGDDPDDVTADFLETNGAEDRRWLVPGTVVLRGSTTLPGSPDLPVAAPSDLLATDPAAGDRPTERTS
jgi:LacI family transcriptional regulator